MPKLAVIDTLGVLLAALAMYIVGFVWYGLLFDTVWMEANGWAASDFEGQSGLWMPAGFLIPLILAFGVGWLMRQRGVNGVAAAAQFGLWLALLVGVPMMMYAYVYSPGHSWILLLIDGSHTVVTYMLGCIILSLFD